MHIKKVHSHYDNLRVTRNAPPSVIKAAYRTLSQQYHPDRCQDPDAQRIMAILNGSYEVLSDPDKRRAHDQWIARQEGSAFHEPPRPVDDGQDRSGTPAQRGAKPQPKLPEPIYIWPLVSSLLKAVPWRVWAVVFIVAAFAYWPSFKTFIEEKSDNSIAEVQSDAPAEEAPMAAAPSAPPTASTPLVLPAAWASPSSTQAALEATNQVQTLSHAPNGLEWPAAAGYLPGYDVDATDGYSTLTIDNTSNDFDVYVKLSFPGAPPAAVYRHVFIPRRAVFTMESLPAGIYEVRYLNLARGTAAKTESFELEEQVTTNGVRYSQVTFTLYTVQNGNTSMKPLPPEQF